jgi:outer membrane immunogenic protein
MRERFPFSYLIPGILVFATLPAMADGAPRVAAKSQATACCTWAGAYIGFNVGWGEGNFDSRNVTEFDPILGPLDYRSFGFSDTGFIAGLQAGYSWQRGELVFGIESDIQGTSVSGSKTFVDSIFEFPGGGLDTRVRAELENLGTLRGRVGLARDHWLMYATAGLAWGEVSTSLSFPPTGGGTNSLNDSDSRWHLGYTVGAGAEVKLSPVVSLKIEYLYVDLGDKRHRFDIGVDRYTWNQDLDLHVVRAGLNFKLGDPGK